jgi:flagellar protein FliS
LSFFDPYQAYVEGSVFSGNPLSNVIALYEGAIDSVRMARQCFETGDILGRGRSINKAITILTELIATLDHEKGGEISANLLRLYAYIQNRIQAAHCQKTEKPLFEAEKLLETMLEGWRQAAEKLDAEARGVGYATPGVEAPNPGFYGGFFSDAPAYVGAISATF